MKHLLIMRLGLVLGLGLIGATVFAQTGGSAKLETTIASYSGKTAHWTVAWVTTESGTFIKSLWKQGTKYTWTSSQWQSHCTTWNTARGGTAGSTNLDGYTSATATTYSGVNSPVILTWNGRDANGNVMPDGNYKFWVQYAEDTSYQGPYTTNGLVWTKGPSAATKTYANQAANFTNMKVTWTPAATVAPTITSATPAGTATVGVPYSFACTASGTAPIAFTASGLPAGLSISTGGVIAGTPTATGTFPGTITAANGTLPNATQAFTIVVGAIIPTLPSVALDGNNLILSGTGPANGTYTILTATEAGAAAAAWSPVATGTFDSAGAFRYTNAISTSVTRTFYRVRVP